MVLACGIDVSHVVYCCYIVVGVGECGSYYEWLRERYVEKRGKLLSALTSAGLKPIAPQGSFFIMADTSDVRSLVVKKP